jgi:predicted nucleic acid-binding protein
VKAVANSSVLIGLSAIGQLSLLSRRFPEGILVPTAVWHEVVESGAGQPGAAEVATAQWIAVQAVNDVARVSLLRAELDEGEAEAIALAWETGLRPVLLDEKDARRVARRLKLSVLGSVGILVWARRAGLISNLSESLEALQMQARFRLSQRVYEEALRAVGEL